MIVLSLNSGSSSLKFGLYRVDVEGGAGGDGAEGVEALLVGQLDDTGELTERLRAGGLPAPQAVGHRIVHGGPALQAHTVIDEAVLRQIEAAACFAPLHTPASLAVIAQARALFPGLPEVACFDTAFHATLPDTARVLPIPKSFQSQGIRRYGFHGLSCESIVFQLARRTSPNLPQGVPERLLIAHLGHGASVTAVLGGRSVDTSMGLTPSGGLIMGTRSGDLDPGLFVYLLRHVGGNAVQLHELLDEQSGLLGISALSGDMRRLHEAEANNANARLAVQMFCASVAKELAAQATVLGGVDLIVFSGGIGENDAAVRAAICAALGWCGVALDASRNQCGQGLISADASRCAVRVLPSQEDEQIARHTARLLRGAA